LKIVVNVHNCAYSFRQLFEKYKNDVDKNMRFSTFYCILRYKIIHPRHGTDMCNMCENYKARLKNHDHISFVSFLFFFREWGVKGRMCSSACVFCVQILVYWQVKKTERHMKSMSEPIRKPTQATSTYFPIFPTAVR
jgi:hypothetical protein